MSPLSRRPPASIRLPPAASLLLPAIGRGLPLFGIAESLHFTCGPEHTDSAAMGLQFEAESKKRVAGSWGLEAGGGKLEALLR